MTEAVIAYVFQMLMIMPVGLIAAYVIVGMAVEISQSCWRKLWRRS